MTRKKRRNYAVVITKGRIGFPEGEYTRVMYKPMAQSIARRLHTVDRVRARVVTVRGEYPGGYSRRSRIRRRFVSHPRSR